MADRKTVILHHDRTADMADTLRGDYPDLEVLECATYEDLPGMIARHQPDAVYTVRFAGTANYPRDALFADDGPAWIANGGVGTDHFGSWDATRTTVTNGAGVAAGMMAEYIIGGFLHFTLDIPGLQADKAARVWHNRTVRPLAGQTLLIVGLGHTGQALALRAKAFGMQVMGTRARPRPMEHVDEIAPASDLARLLPRADFIAVCTPLTPATRGLVGETEIAAMKPGVILADVSRGGVIDQTALAQAMRAGHVGGAALDVFEVEPLPGDSPLWDLPNLVISPHCSAVHAGWEEASLHLFRKNLDRWMHNEPLVNIVDPDRGY